MRANAATDTRIIVKKRAYCEIYRIYTFEWNRLYYNIYTTLEIEVYNEKRACVCLCVFLLYTETTLLYQQLTKSHYRKGARGKANLRTTHFICSSTSFILWADYYGFPLDISYRWTVKVVEKERKKETMIPVTKFRTVIHP